MKEANAERPRTDSSLAITESLFHSIVDHMLDALLILDWNGVIIFANRAAADLVELASPEEGIGRNAAEFIHPDFYETVLTDLLNVREGGGGYLNRYKVITNRGRERWVEGLGTRIPLGDGTANLVTIRDIGEIKESERMLQERETRLRELSVLQQAVLDGANYSIISTGPDGTIKTFNAAAERWLGWRAEELIGRHTPAVFHDPEEIRLRAAELSRELGTDIPPGFEVFVAKTRLGIPDEQEWTYIRKDRSRFPVSLSVTVLQSADGEITGFLGIGSDITARRQAEEELRKLSQAVKQSPVAVIITTPDGKMDYVNPRFTELTGYTAAEAAGQNPRILKSGEKTAAEYRELWETICSGRIWQGVFHNRKKDGGYYWASASISPIKNASGEITHFVGIQEDITSLKMTEQALKEAKEAAEAANIAKSEFLAGMSHEIRTPMNAIIGMAELLAETPLNPEQQQYLQIFRSAGESLLSLINDILDLSKVEAGRLILDTSPFHLGEVVEKTCEIMSVRAHQKGIELACRIAPDVSMDLLGDAPRLQQVLINLIGNAVKFTDKGEVIVQVDCAEADRPSGKDNECLLHFSVRDTGIGIPADKQERIFERFTQADASTTKKYGGTGLGLTISRQLVELMGGRIWLESEFGRGSVFHFTARFRRGEAIAPSETIAVIPPRAETRPLRILLVDDSDDNRFLMKAYLKNTPHTVEMAENGAQAAEKFRGGDYDLVLMDMQMPVMDGYTATRAIRSWEQEQGRRRTPIVALTAYALKEDEEKSLAAGCDAHLTKPIKKARLMDVIASCTAGNCREEVAGEETGKKTER
ncbi:MAG: PAS domain S-box protein [Syntrophobacterales bacterium]|nr:PAS domain S-box protein [Syntrophobacterales bacterium]